VGKPDAGDIVNATIATPNGKRAPTAYVHERITSLPICTSRRDMGSRAGMPLVGTVANDDELGLSALRRVGMHTNSLVDACSLRSVGISVQVMIAGPRGSPK